ncbi:MAG: hypothetical protein NC453_28560 [Muribaculum sp.]|nr:hypothetical protein [Muribaculum sp.]
MSNLIKTNIKFYKGLDNMEDRLYGFVTKSNGSWMGCRETEPKKKIVFVDSSISHGIVPNALYKCTLRKMKNKEGFIAVTASLVRFRSRLVSVRRKGVFMIRIEFGNKMLIYDPSSRERRRRDIQKIADNLRNRYDLENPGKVAEDFVNQACIVKQLYEQAHVH